MASLSQDMKQAGGHTGRSVEEEYRSDVLKSTIAPGNGERRKCSEKQAVGLNPRIQGVKKKLAIKRETRGEKTGSCISSRKSHLKRRV